MPLGTRELLMVIRARDVASRVLQEVGTNVGILGEKGGITAGQLVGIGAALTGVGVALAATGAAGLSFFNDATNAAMDYNRQAALTRTQVDDLGVSVQQIGDIGKRVAEIIPAPFDQMQAALYDIFSSMDIGTRDAEMLLTQFSKGAVAGQTDIQVAARSTISLMNAYGLPFTDATRVMDIMFQLVRKGVGTYEEFNSSIGRAVPAAVAAGQSIESLAGMMAFLTRNGLSTEMAATSAARAMELFSKPEKFKALEDLGVKVRDSTGHFLQMNDIVTQLANNQGWAQMAEPQRKQMFEDIFGAGTIQARRFFDLAVPNFEQLNGLTGDMANSAGALEGAYQTMFEQPASQADLLRNRFEILKTEIGDELIPAKMRLLEVVQKLFDWWNNLSEGTQDLIIKIGLFTSVFMVVFGVILTVVGAFLMLIGIIAPLVGGIGAAILVISGIGVAIAAVIAIGALLIANWDTVSKFAKEAWATVKEAAGDAWHTMQDFWDWVSRNAVAVWHTVRDAVVTAWNAVKSATAAVVGVLQTVLNWLSGNFGDGFMKVWNTITEETGNLLSELAETFSAIFNYINEIIELFWSVAQPVFQAFVDFITGPMLDGLEILWAQVNLIFNLIWQYIQMALDIVITVVKFALDIVMAAWNNFHQYILDRIIAVWNLMATLVSSAITIISNIIQFVLNIIQGDWDEAWQNVKNILGAAWDAIWGVIQYFWGLLVSFFTGLIPSIVGFLWDAASALYNRGAELMGGLWNGIQAIWNSIWEFITSIPGKVKDFFVSAGAWLRDAGKNIIDGLWGGLKDKWNNEVAPWLAGLKNAFQNLKGPPAEDARLLVNNGELIMDSLLTGLMSGWSDVERFLMDATAQMSDLMSPTLTPSIDPSTLALQQMAAQQSALGPGGIGAGIYVENLNVREERMVDDLGFWYASQASGV